MRLLVDFGNSRLKWAGCSDSGLVPGGVFTHGAMPLRAALLREWRPLAGIDAVWVASVVAPALEDELAACVRERFDRSVHFVRSPAAALGVRNAYAEPARLGVDRFLAMVAAHAQAPRLQVLASVGTALTVDALAADGAHLGGLILPGPLLMRRALASATARVQPQAGSYHDWPASTDDGVYSGALYAAAGAIGRFRDLLARRCGATPAVLLGGGGSDELAPLLPDARRVHDLVLQGLAAWARTPPA